MKDMPKPHELPICWWDASIRALDASPWTILLARLFGRRFSGEDSGHIIIGHEWRGNLYVTAYREI